MTFLYFLKETLIYYSESDNVDRKNHLSSIDVRQIFC